MSKSAVIVGAGLAGLLCGRILSRQGWEVTLVEACSQPGGLLAPFLWDGIPCETGFHSVGGLHPGGPLEKIFRPLGLMDLPWYRADEDEGYPFLRLNSGSEQELRHILDPYKGSTWRLKGGGRTLIKELAKGLDIKTGNKVISLENHTVVCAGCTFESDTVISSLHPSVTFSLLKDHVRPSYLKRLSKMENGPGIFSVYCLLEPGCVPWQSGDIFWNGNLMLHFGEPETDILELLRFTEGNPEEMIAHASQRLPGLKVRKYHTAYHYGYGLKKETPDHYLSPVTPLPWLFLTGQNLGLHGILGTAVSALNTCKSVQP